MFFLKTPTLILLLSLLLISGCSSNEMNIIEVFHSDIQADDTKLFTFSIIVVRNSASEKPAGEGRSMDTKRKKNRQGKGRGNKNSTDNKSSKQPSEKKEKQQDKITNELESRLAETLADNNYCRAGFFELERSISKTIFAIKGECNESATGADRDNFPQTKQVGKR
jgi:hypothetical protein